MAVHDELGNSECRGLTPLNLLLRVNNFNMRCKQTAIIHLRCNISFLLVRQFTGIFLGGKVRPALRLTISPPSVSRLSTK
jgi:hypothetical protein